jgi:CHAD domain-containing protein
MAFDAQRIQKNVQKLRKILKEGFKRPSPEEIHRLRTQTRRFEFAMDAFALASKRKERRLLRDLGRIRKRAGKVRDMDVLTSHLSDVRVVEERDCLVQLFEYLGAERYRHARRLRALIRGSSSVTRRRLQRASVRLAKLVDEDNHKNNSSNKRVETTAAASAFHLTTELRTPATLSRGNLHAYRLKVKALRYVLQMGENPDQQRFIEALGRSKNGIGEWHDCVELVVIATEILEHAPQCGLLRRLKSTSEEKYKFALKVTNKMRSDHLRLSKRTRGRGSGAKLSPARPAVKVVSGLVA